VGLRRPGIVRGQAAAHIRAAIVLSACLGVPTVLVLPAGVAAVLQEGPNGWAVSSARMEADLRAGDGSAEVRISYVFVAALPDARLPLAERIPIELLGFGDATATEVHLGSGVTIALAPTVGSHRAAALQPSESESGDVLRPEGSSGDALRVEIRYRVEQAVVFDGPRLRGRIPAVTGPAPIAGGDGFEAVVLLPDAWVVSDGFPSGLAPGPSGFHEVSLPVVPAMVGFRARTDGRRRPGLPLLIDLLTLTILLGFAAFGLRHLRSVAARADA
jgi:hypothetical protein